MTTLVQFLADLARQPAMPLSNLDAAARAAGVTLSDAERDAIRRHDAAGLSELVEPGPTYWCMLFPAEDAPEKAPDEQPQQDAPPAEPPPADPKTH